MFVIKRINNKLEIIEIEKNSKTEQQGYSYLGNV